MNFGVIYQILLEANASGNTRWVIDLDGKANVLNAHARTQSVTLETVAHGIAELERIVKGIDLQAESRTSSGLCGDRIRLSLDDVWETIDNNQPALVIDSGDNPETELDYEVRLSVTPILLIGGDATWGYGGIVVRNVDDADNVILFTGNTPEQTFHHMVGYFGTRTALLLVSKLARVGGSFTLGNLSVELHPPLPPIDSPSQRDFVSDPVMEALRIEVARQLPGDIVKSVSYMHRGDIDLPKEINWEEYGFTAELRDQAITEFHLAGLDRVGIPNTKIGLRVPMTGGSLSITIKHCYYKAE